MRIDTSIIKISCDFGNNIVEDVIISDYRRTYVFGVRFPCQVLIQRQSNMIQVKIQYDTGRGQMSLCMTHPLMLVIICS